MRKGNKIDISIIIVNYHVKKELLACIKSIYASKPKISFEIIVVDNDETKTIRRELQENFPKVAYVPNENKGYGQGNNTGARHAKGNYLFILNPDTQFLNNVVDELVKVMEKDKSIAIAAPLLFGTNKTAYALQGSQELTPLRALFTFSFISNIFPKNSIRQNYWFQKWNKKTSKEVEAVPGTAFIIKRDLFNQLQGFDEKFFLYFEETDLCKRVRQLGKKIVMVPAAKLYHAWGKSTDKSSKNINSIFLQSRFYYFKKHFGLVAALLTESFLRFNKYKLLLTGILLVSLAVIFYRLGEFMAFIGDQGWYFLQARNMMTSGSIPLVGIPSSHPWLHQGAFWTYMLGPALMISNYDPMGGAYLTIILHIVTVCVLYAVITKIFSERIALLAAFFYALSPFVIIQAMMPYHTNPIPILSILYFFALYKWLKENIFYFPVSIFLLALLYNFEVATFLLTIVLLLILAFGLVKRTHWFRSVLNKKILILSFAAFTLPMLPMLIHDFGHGFPQTAMFLAWVMYKVLLVFGFPPVKPPLENIGYDGVLVFLGESYKKFVYLSGGLVAFTLAIFSFGFLGKSILDQIRSKTVKTETVLIGIIVLISVIGIVVAKTPSEAYLPVLFPFIALILALFIDTIIKLRPRMVPVLILILGLMFYENVSALIHENYFNTKGLNYSYKVAVAKRIVSEANGREYNLVGKGGGSQHESFTSNYEYLTWWQGNAPSKTEQELRFVLEETSTGIKLTKVEKK